MKKMQLNLNLSFTTSLFLIDSLKPDSKNQHVTLKERNSIKITTNRCGTTGSLRSIAN